MDSGASPGRCPGLARSAPLARHRGCVLERRNCYKAIYEIASGYKGPQLSGDGRGGQGLWVQRFLGFFDSAVDGGLPIGMRDD